MYVSIIVSGIILVLLVGTLLLLHWLAATFPVTAHVISMFEMIILISILILVHEAGHFFVAELFKIPVTKFAFGMPIGPTLWKRKFGNIEILVHAFLFGGYVAFPDDDKDLNLPPDSPDRFMNRPAYQRFFVLSAGVTANVICAFIFVILTASIWGQMPSGKYEIYVKNIVAPKTESIWQSGMQNGDKISQINGYEIQNPNSLVTYVTLHKKFDSKVNNEDVENVYNELKKLNRAFTRDEIIPEDIALRLVVNKTETPLKLDKDILRGLAKFKDKRTELTEVQKRLRNEVQGKTVLISDGTFTLNDLAYALTDNVTPVNIVVERNGEKVNLKPIYPNEKGTIGIMMEIKEVIIPTKNPVAVIKTGTKYLWDQSVMLVYGLYQIFTGKIPVSDLHGIIAITKVGGDVIHNSGIFSGLLLTAVISIDLAIMNFLPLPALDGGHVMFLIIEKIRGKRLDDETVEKIGTFFFLFLIGLMILVCFNDIYALIMKKF